MSSKKPDMTKIAAGGDGVGPLYLGAIAAARELKPLQDAKVTHIVDVTETDVDHEGVRHESVKTAHL